MYNYEHELRTTKLPKNTEKMPSFTFEVNYFKPISIRIAIILYFTEDQRYILCSLYDIFSIGTAQILVNGIDYF